MRSLILICLASAAAAVPQTLKFECSTAMVCVDKSMCDKFGVMSKTTVTLTEKEELNRHPLVECKKPAGGDGVCCRDPDYKDDWPADWVDPGRMSYEEYMALRIKKMVYTTTTTKPVPTTATEKTEKTVAPVIETIKPKYVEPIGPIPEPTRPLPVEPIKPLPPFSALLSDDQGKSDKTFARVELTKQEITPTTAKTLIIGIGRVVDSEQQIVTSAPQTASKHDQDLKVLIETDAKVDRGYAGPAVPAEIVSSKPFEFYAKDAKALITAKPIVPKISTIQHVVTKEIKPTKKQWPSNPIVVVGEDSIEIHSKNKQLEVVSIEASKPSKTIKKVVYTKAEPVPKKRVKVNAEPTRTTLPPTQTGLQHLLLAGCPRRNRTAMPDLNTKYDDSDFDAGAGEFPWQAAVFDRNNRFLCPCFFTEEDTCLTTANCVVGLMASDIKIVVGTYDIDAPTKVTEVPTGNKAAQILDCEAIDRHAYFNAKTNQYDMALLFITQTVALNYFTLPICVDRPEGIPVSRRLTTPFNDCVATGWGHNATYHWFDVELLPQKDCAGLVKGFDAGMQSCARPSVKMPHNVCDMIESGGGLQCRYMGDRMSRKNEVYWLKGTLTSCIAETQTIVYSHLDLDWFEETINARRYQRSHLWRAEQIGCRF